MSDVVNLSRRRFLQNAALMGGGLILGFQWPGTAQAAKADAGGEWKANAFVRLAPDGSVTMVVNHSEMGQGCYTSAAMLMAEELDADWTRVKAVAAPVHPDYNHSAFGIQMTGGSSSTWSEYDRMRKAGAAARAMLVAAAAAQWKVDAKELRTENGTVFHDKSKKSVPYAKLVKAAAKLSAPKDVSLKDPKDFKIIGKAIKRLDTPDKTNGRAQFSLDVSLPGMLTAVIARPPVFGGKLKSFDGTKAKQVPGVKHVVQIERGVAVVADSFFAAKRGRDALVVEWDEGPEASLDSKAQGEAYRKLAAEAGVPARKDGDAAAALSKASKKVEATYDLPFLAHATMEPMNAVADVRTDRATVWTGSQFQTADRATAARIAGLPPEKVELVTTLLGGGFGRRAVADCHMVAEATETSKLVKAPVKVVWTREDDMRGGYYRPRSVHVVKAALDDKGALHAWEHQLVVQSFVMGTPFEGFIVKNGVDHTAVEGAADSPYDIPNFRVDWHQAKNLVPTLWWRSVGHTHTAFVMETLVDEMAALAGKDPVEFRRTLLAKKPRIKAVLDLVAEKSGWGQPAPEGRARGIAIHESFQSIVAHVAEVSIVDGQPRVHKVTTAIDCGPVINPDTVAAQMESGIVYGTSAALFGQITFEKGRVVQGNFHDYPVLRMHQMPQVEVHIVPSTDKMGGTGEPGVPPIAPAIANALFHLTGTRIRELPILTVTPKKA